MNRQIIYLGLLACAINICFTFQNSNLSSIFKFLGACNDNLPYLWLIPPLSGLLIQPIVGQLSDDTATRLGKRRPYILMWGVFASLAFIFLPFFNSLPYIILFFLIIDCSLNGGLEAMRALTGDNIKNQTERSKAFAFQATLSGIGGVIGAGLPYVIHKFTRFKGDQALSFTIPANMKATFVILGLISLTTIYLCLFHLREKNYRSNLLKIKQKKLPFQQKFLRLFSDFYISLKKMPTGFRTLCYIHSMTWMGIFIFWLFITVTIAQNIYGLPARMLPHEQSHVALILQQAALDSSFYASIYQYVSVAYSLFIYFKANTAKLYYLHAVSLLAGGIGLLIIGLTHYAPLLMLAFALIGIMWGSMMVLPYCIVMQLLPKARMGIYLGIFNICITLPQIICGMVLSPIYSYFFHEQASYLLILASGLVMMSAILWGRQEKHAEEHRELSKKEFASA